MLRQASSKGMRADRWAENKNLWWASMATEIKMHGTCLFYTSLSPSQKYRTVTENSNFVCKCWQYWYGRNGSVNESGRRCHMCPAYQQNAGAEWWGCVGAHTYVGCLYRWCHEPSWAHRPAWKIYNLFSTQLYQRDRKRLGSHIGHQSSPMYFAL